MKILLYDENSYPSGFAGGHVPAEMPESMIKYLMLKKTTRPDTIPNKFMILQRKDPEFIAVDSTNRHGPGYRPALADLETLSE